MEIFRFNIRSLEEIERREAFKKEVNCCPHCGQSLQFEVQIDTQTQMLQEEGKCASCGTHVRTEIHSLN